MNIERYRLSEDERLKLESRFSCLGVDVRLDFMDESKLSLLPEVVGCYLWIAEIEKRKYKLYIGRTKSLRKRVRDYSSRFQVHSPNDYKLRLVLSELGVVFPGLSLELYFAPAVSVQDSKLDETKLVRELAPIINTLPRPSAVERGFVEEAFRKYYGSVLLRHLGVEV